MVFIRPDRSLFFLLVYKVDNVTDVVLHVFKLSGTVESLLVDYFEHGKVLIFQTFHLLRYLFQCFLFLSLKQFVSLFKIYDVLFYSWLEGGINLGPTLIHQLLKLSVCDLVFDVFREFFFALRNDPLDLVGVELELLKIVLFFQDFVFKS